MFGELNTVEIETLIKSQLIGRIGCHADGVTYVVPISYAYDGANIYCHTFDGMKINIMRKNPEICFQVDETKNLANWQSVISWGRFEEITDGNERNEALRILEDRTLPILSSETMHLAPQWPFSCSGADCINGIVFRINLIQKTGRFERNAGEFFFAT